MDSIWPPSRRLRTAAFWNPETLGLPKGGFVFPIAGAGPRRGGMRGTVHGSRGGVYRVCLDSGELLEASLRGRLKREARTGDKVVIGDWVEVVTGEDGSVTIETVGQSSIGDREEGAGRPAPEGGGGECGPTRGGGRRRSARARAIPPGPPPGHRGGESPGSGSGFE